MNWILIKTKPNQEKRAKINLENQSMETFLPLYLKKLKYKGNAKETLKPLFPGYIFVQFSDITPLDKIKYTFGVSYVVKTKNKALLINNEIIEDIKNRIGINGYVELSKPAYEKGQGVKITEGPFKDYEAIFYEDIKDSDRVCILLNIAQKDIKLKINRDDIELKS
ncbi:MAG: transcription termination/antitermination NusG family protein [Pseudomonadota bacterium]